MASLTKFHRKEPLYAYKKERLLDIIEACAGLFYEANAQKEHVLPGEKNYRRSFPDSAEQ